MAPLQISPIPLLQDNYAWLLHDSEAGVTAVVDPSEAAPVAAALKAQGLSLNFVLNTHHHHDHTGGNRELKEWFGCQVIGPEYDRSRISSMDRGVREGEQLRIGDHIADILYIPGHTLGHIGIWFRDSKALFCGDTLFSLGCGRLFEGTPEQMWTSLSKLAALPKETKIYCGHEYTEANARFALSVDPDNLVLKARADEVKALRGQSKPTVPSSLEQELEANPFLRANQPQLRQALNLNGQTDVAVFASLRQRKDVF